MISVAIVDDQRDIREGLQNILNLAEDIQCAGAYADAESAIEGILATPPDVVLMDIELPEMSGIDCVKILKRKLPALNVIMLTSYTEDKYVFQSLRAGAYGYLTKNIFPSKLVGAIREVCHGGAPMESHIARRVVASFNHVRSAIPDLSQRERDVLHLLCEGKSYKAMAKRLYVSPNTIRFHLKNIYKKLDVNSRHEAVIKASRVGIPG
jgi:DNA-binding NarL/FixJ family response regulator